MTCRQGASPLSSDRVFNEKEKVRKAESRRDPPGMGQSHGKGRHSLALSVAIPDFSQDGVFTSEKLHYSSCTLELYDSKLPFKRDFHVHFLPSLFLLFFFLFPCVLCSFLVLFLLFSLCFCPLSVLALLQPPQMEEHSGCCSGGEIKALQKPGAGRTCD